MKLFKNKTKKVAAIALFLIMTIVALSTSLPTVAAKIETLGYVSVTPKTSQINSTVQINAWTSPTPPEAPMGSGTNLEFRPGNTFTITKPDGNTVTLGPFSAYADGTLWTSYKVDQVGTWKITLYWPGDNNFTAVTSPAFTFYVQEEPVPGWPAAPLPSEYWTRPVYAENREWKSLLADWNVNGIPEGGSYYQPYGSGPITAHILWTKLTGPGGIMSEQWSAASYRSGAVSVRAVMAGYAYLSLADGYHCIDIYTGEELWGGKTIPGTLYWLTLDTDPDPGGAATHCEIWSYRQKGWIEIYDPFTGLWKSNVTSAGWENAGISAYYDGWFYWLNGKNWTKWNPFDLSSAAKAAGKASMRIPYADRIEWSVTITGLNPSIYSGNIAVDSTCKAGYSLETGALLWNVTSRAEATYYRNDNTVGQGYFFQSGMKQTWYAYDLQTGTLKWESEKAEYPWGTFWSYTSGNGEGYLFGMGYDGHVYAFDIKTGKIVWSFYAGDSTEAPYNTWAFWQAPVINDGKVYAGTTEHTPTQPRVRGNRMYCINDTDGTAIWSISGAYLDKIIADTFLISTNEYDSVMYCFGKGKTATAVTASPKVSTWGTSVLIEGTVLDMSPGQPGTAAVSDDSMSAWMEYLHMQKSIPADVTGVSVSLDTLDPNGNFVHIGDVTSDMSGSFSCMWTPEVQGTYTVFATFTGSESYWSSTAETAVGVTAAPTATPTPEPEPSPPYEMYTIGAAIAIIIAVAIATILILRKR